jgi:hypothetical protein
VTMSWGGSSLHELAISSRDTCPSRRESLWILVGDRGRLCQVVTRPRLHGTSG